MNSDKVVSGIIFIGVGILLLLANLGMFSWWVLGSLWDFWPLVLVVVGINIIFKKRVIVSIISWVLFFSILIGYSFYYDGKVTNNSEELTELQIEKRAETTNGELKLNLGGLRLKIDASDENMLLDTNYSSSYIESNQYYRNGNKEVTLEFKPLSNRINLNFNMNPRGEEFYFNLNKDTIWEIDANMGAVSGEMNLTDLQVKDLKLKVGAGSLDILFGEAYPESNVKIDAGASKLDIYIMETTGVKMKIEGLVSKTNLSNLGWMQRGDFYYSPNYEEAASKAHFDISAGVGKINVIVR